MRILIVTDAWSPQVNGVVRTLQAVTAELWALGHEVKIISPDQFRSFPCPTYPEIRLALAPRERIGAQIKAWDPNAVHIATEGPLGWAARGWCLRNGIEFTTAYHTQFPEYVARRTGIPADWLWSTIRLFHGPSQSILVATGSVEQQLHKRGLKQTRRWTRGVDLDIFRPGLPAHPRLAALPRPLLLYVGRVAPEKNIEAFLASQHRGSKVVVGDGPSLAKLKGRYPKASFLGALGGADLASAYAAADVLVFPSKTDTFGLVMIEALACGTPVAAFPVCGPIDIIGPEVGAMREDLDRAIEHALDRSRAACAAYGARFSWAECAAQFVAALAPLKAGLSKAA